jgi:HD-like signal output (HDOD) protein
VEHVSPEIVENLLKGVAIPPRPAVLAAIDAELRRDDPDAKAVSELIARDVGLSASMLRALNSPLLGLQRKVGSVTQAVHLLGMRNVRSIVTGLVLRNAIGGGTNLERFWDSAEKVASINAYICTLLPKAPREESFTFGLFRDCGIPLLMQRFPDYRETLKVAAGDARRMAEVEDERHGTNHATVGHFMARVWGLPDAVCEAILRHHDTDCFQETGGANPMARTLVAINMLAEHLNETAQRMRQDIQWERHGDTVLDYLGLSQSDYLDIFDRVQSLSS